MSANELLKRKMLESKSINFEDDLKEAKELEQQKFYTAAFLRQWRIVESISRELMITWRACNEASETGKRLVKSLKRRKIDIVNNGLSKEVVDILYSSIKKRIESSCRNIDVGYVEKALLACGVELDSKKLHFLLASKIEGRDLSSQFSENITIREMRNRLIHQNQSLSLAEYGQFLPFFECFFDLVVQTKGES